jgi:hypothetical protein
VPCRGLSEVSDSLPDAVRRTSFAPADGQDPGDCVAGSMGHSRQCQGETTI